MDRSRCQHDLPLHISELPGLTTWYAQCGLCLMSGKGTSFGEAVDNFWKTSNQFEEKPMSTEYDRGYKQGVLDAAAPMPYDDKQYRDPSLGGLTTFDFTNLVLETRRNSLLTKKVTKWVNVYTDGSPWVPLHQGYGLYESKDDALSKNPAGFPGYLGTYPIEIEVSL